LTHKLVDMATINRKDINDLITKLGMEN
jgi:hypothetical protein